MTFGIAINTSTPEGAAFMGDSIRAWRDHLAKESTFGRVLSALDSHRRTQRNARQGVRGYYATAAESRAAVREAVARVRIERT